MFFACKQTVWKIIKELEDSYDAMVSFICKELMWRLIRELEDDDDFSVDEMRD